jgi:hypothetical protein
MAEFAWSTHDWRGGHEEETAWYLYDDDYSCYRFHGSVRLQSKRWIGRFWISQGWCTTALHYPTMEEAMEDVEKLAREIHHA